MLLPALASFLYLVPFIFIKDDKKQKAQIEKELAEHHAAKLEQEALGTAQK